MAWGQNCQRKIKEQQWLSGVLKEYRTWMMSNSSCSRFGFLQLWCLSGLVKGFFYWFVLNGTFCLLFCAMTFQLIPIFSLDAVWLQFYGRFPGNFCFWVDLLRAAAYTFQHFWKYLSEASWPLGWWCTQMPWSKGFTSIFLCGCLTIRDAIY